MNELRRQHRVFAIAVSLCLILAANAYAKPQASDDVRITVASDVPDLQRWVDEAGKVAEEWHPRIANLLSTPQFTAPRVVELRIRKSDKGVGFTVGTNITISSHWIEKHPEDVGLVIHELVHVIQAYPNGGPGWVTEGIADYVRRVIFEGRKQSWFPVPDNVDGYRKGYGAAAGFFFWLETDRAPGIVRKLNRAMRRGQYSDGLFESETDSSLEILWLEYQRSRKQNDRR